MSNLRSSIVSLKNRLLSRVQARRHGSPVWNRENYFAVPVPERIDIGLTDYCNEKCFMCPNPSLPSPRGYMDEELFRRIVDEARGLGMRSVGLGLFGEPTMHKRFMDFIRYINDQGLEFYCSTNAVALRNDISDFLVDHANGRLHLSLYATSERSFELVHGINGKGYNVVVRNVEYLLNRLSKAESSKLLLFMNYLDTGKDEGGYRVWLDKWLPLLQQVPHVESTEKAYITWMGRVEKGPHDREGRGVIRYNRPCDKITRRLAVDWDGRVTACCFSWDEKSLNLGNIKSQSLIEIWKGEQLRAVRTSMLRGDVSGLPGCAKCEHSLSTVDPLGFARRVLRFERR
jgi:radical SAM protein with 4Fe4S-binding SPASM domain